MADNNYIPARVSSRLKEQIEERATASRRSVAAEAEVLLSYAVASMPPSYRIPEQIPS
jgi:hypothetical protein